MPEPVRLLVVSDSDLYAARIVGALEAKGLSAPTERVASPDAMRGALLRGPWDAAVADLAVPGFDIDEVVRLAKGVAPDLSVIVVSGMAEKEGLPRALRAGASEFVPMADLECVVCAVKRVVREAEVRRELLSANGRVREKDGLLREVLANAPAVDDDGRLLSIPVFRHS